ncbi:MAG: hypothetical protein DRJ01_15315 [Bacteroidetes bacterium]|nr:MAG: hypothetical protein DRJ01_15315 [Bacteroidota bacterium]
MNSSYYLFTISIIVFIAYIISFFLSRISIIKKSTHKKIWNSLLLITFLVSATLGIILVIQINYKLDFPLLDKILIWHVNFGISMSIIAIFHLSWHLKYFQNIFKKQKRKISSSKITKFQEENIKSDTTTIKSIDKKLRFSVIVLGITSILTQIIFLREFMSFYYGNELVIGIILANWMLITGLGAFLGKNINKVKNQASLIIILEILLGITPFITIFSIYFLRNIIFTVGSMIGIIQILYTSFLFLLPFCLISGFSFTLLTYFISSKYNTNFISKIYSLESLGSIIGGLIFNLFLIFYFKTFTSLLLIIIINFIAAFLLSSKYKIKLTKYVIIILSIFFIVISIKFNLDYLTKSHQYINQKLIFQKDTPYGNLAITTQGEQKNFYENNVLLFSTNDITANEEAVHYAMIQHNNPKNILLISGGISGVINEILKYNIKQIDYVEINNWITKIGKKYDNSLKNKKVNIINKDARLYIKKTSKKYDVVLINLPDPTTAQINRYYTAEFFTELKTTLNKNAVISINLSSTANYISDEARQINSVLYNTLKHSFKNIIIIPGGKNYFIASDKKLSLDIAELIEKKGINNEYVNQYYIDDNLLKQRSDYVLKNLNKNAKINKDFTPVSYYNQLLYWLSYFKSDLNLFAIIILLFLILIVANLNIINLGLFSAGFAGSSVEIILLISFQIIYGYIFQMTGIIITIFMIGLAIGAFYTHKFLQKATIKNYSKILFTIGIYSLLLPIILLMMKSNTLIPVFTHATFGILTLIISILVGIEFSLASKIQMGNTASVTAKIYSADLLGSAIGALIVTTYLIPLLGIIKVSIIIGIFNLLIGMVIFMKRHNRTQMTQI